MLRDAQQAGAGRAEAGQELRARASNYLAAGALTEHGVQLTDQLTGQSLTFTADVIVNTTGAWVDQTNAALGAPSRYMGGTKGSHIVLDHPQLLAACAGREMFFEHTDGRIVLIYPMGDRVLVGTTDIDADISQDTVCTQEEVDYFLELIGHVFPRIGVGADSIVYSFSGVRPLPRHDETQPGFVSRDYRIERGERSIAGRSVPVLSLVGGKWTTFRALGEHLANDVLAILGAKRRVSTAGLPIGGGAGFPRTDDDVERWVRSRTGGSVDVQRAMVLLTRYGTRAHEVIGYLQAGEDNLFSSTPELSSRELEYMVGNEQVGHLVDVLIRRTSLAFRGLVTPELLAETAQALAGPLGWSEARCKEEIRDAEEILDRFHSVRVQNLTA